MCLYIWLAGSHHIYDGQISMLLSLSLANNGTIRIFDREFLERDALWYAQSS